MAFTYSTYYTLRNTRAADTTVLGLDWEGGEGGEGGAGKPIVCVLYALVIFVSCLWMPATLKALRGEGSVTYVVAILNVVVSRVSRCRPSPHSAHHGQGRAPHRPRRW